MRARLSTQLSILIIFFYLNYVLYFNRDYFVPRDEKTAEKDTELIATGRYGTAFCVAFNVTRGQDSFEEDGRQPVSLAVHTTSIHLNYVLEQVATWDGPISVALFVDPNSQKAAAFLYNIYLCDPVFARKVSLHVVFRLSPFSSSCPSMKFDVMPCSEVTYKYTNRFMNTLVPPFTIYPINTMRNVARKGAPSHFQLLSDVEMIFSDDFARLASKISNENLCEECGNLIVVRRFELEDKIKKMPKTIARLKELVDDGSAFEFHHKLYPAGHTIEALWHWFRVSNSSKEPFVWEIPYKGPAWEPQLIMHSSASLSEEDVPTRFKDQQVLVFELCRANYTFLLTSHLFNVHRGVKTNATILDTAVKNHQSRLRDRSLRRYLRRINSAYSNDTAKRCGKFSM